MEVQFRQPLSAGFLPCFLHTRIAKRPALPPASLRFTYINEILYTTGANIDELEPHHDRYLQSLCTSCSGDAAKNSV